MALSYALIRAESSQISPAESESCRRGGISNIQWLLILLLVNDTRRVSQAELQDTTAKIRNKFDVSLSSEGFSPVIELLLKELY